MKLNSDYERGLVIQFSAWFIKHHDLKLEDQNSSIS